MCTQHCARHFRFLKKYQKWPLIKAYQERWDWEDFFWKQALNWVLRSEWTWNGRQNNKLRVGGAVRLQACRHRGRVMWFKGGPCKPGRDPLQEGNFELFNYLFIFYPWKPNTFSLFSHLTLTNLIRIIQHPNCSMQTAFDIIQTTFQQ